MFPVATVKLEEDKEERERGEKKDERRGRDEQSGRDEQRGRGEQRGIALAPGFVSPTLLFDDVLHFIFRGDGDKV